MVDETLSLEEVCAELGMTEAAVRAAVQSGRLLAIPDEDPPKFGRKMVDQFREQLPTDATLAIDDGADQDSSHLDLGAAGTGDEGEDPNEITEFSMEVEDDESTSSRIDLAEVEAEAGADESDQTSVLPVGEEVADEGSQDEAVFDFAEEDLGLAEDESSDVGEMQTVESDSSADILEVADEMDEESSSDALVAVSEESESESPALSESDVVAEMLDAGVEESEDELDTIDLDDMEPEEGSDDLMSVVEDETVGSSTDTASMDVDESALSDEAETVSLDAQDMETEGVTAEMEAGHAGEEEMEEPAGDYGAAAAMARPMAAAPPAIWANAVLILAVLLVAFGGFVMLCEATGATANPVIEFVRDFVRERFPDL